MKALLLLTVLAQAPVAPATPPQLSRADVHFVIGWQNLRNERAHDEYDDWLNNIFYGGAGAGWYWSDHLKTQVDIRTAEQKLAVANYASTSAPARRAVETATRPDW